MAIDWLLGFVAAFSGLAVQETPPAGEETGDEFGDEAEALSKLGIEGPVTGELRDIAAVQVPAGYMFVDAAGTRKLLEAWGNLSDDGDLGLVTPISDDEEWAVVFEWAAVGKIEDDEELDAEELFDQMKEGEEASNEERAKRGFEPLELVRFTTPPHYDAATHNLEWGLLIRSPSGASVNYQVKLLGRRGFMSATLLCDPTTVESVLPSFKTLLDGYTWVEGQRYSEWTQGDPIAEFGITGLVVGGAAAAAWKLGILGKLAKFGKAIVIGVLAVVGGAWKWLSGRRKQSPTP